MKKILIVSNNLKIGGIQKALINMLGLLEDRYDITILLFNPKGEYINKVSDKVKILNSNSFLELLACSQEEARLKGFYWYCLRAGCMIWSKFFNNSLPFKILMSSTKKITGFDYAISYVHANDEKKCYPGCNEFVLDKVDSKIKVAYIHCDFLNYGGNTLHNRKKYKKFDKIVAVSNGCKESFVSAIPELKDRTYTIRNFNNFNEILKLSNDNTVIYDKDVFNIVTVSRLSKEKGINRCIPIIKHIIEKGHKVKWHVIGGGPLEKNIRKSIIDYQLEDHVILYGNQSNPYRFMKNADLFLLPSYHEAAPMVFDEAKCLAVPILSTRTVSVKELIEDNNIGWVCENNDKSILNYLIYLLENNEELKEKKFQLETMNFNNDSPLKMVEMVFK